jgi:hypothetical protein
LQQFHYLRSTQLLSSNQFEAQSQSQIRAIIEVNPTYREEKLQKQNLYYLQGRLVRLSSVVSRRLVVSIPTDAKAIRHLRALSSRCSRETVDLWPVRNLNCRLFVSLSSSLPSRPIFACSSALNVNFESLLLVPVSAAQHICSISTTRLVRECQLPTDRQS